MIMKLRIREVQSPLGYWWICYDPLQAGFLQRTSAGSNPYMAYYNYFNPVTPQSSGIISIDPVA